MKSAFLSAVAIGLFLISRAGFCIVFQRMRRVATTKELRVTADQCMYTLNFVAVIALGVMLCILLLSC